VGVFLRKKGVPRQSEASRSIQRVDILLKFLVSHGQQSTGSCSQQKTQHKTCVFSHAHCCRRQTVPSVDFGAKEASSDKTKRPNRSGGSKLVRVHMVNTLQIGRVASSYVLSDFSDFSDFRVSKRLKKSENAWSVVRPPPAAPLFFSRTWFMVFAVPVMRATVPSPCHLGPFYKERERERDKELLHVAS